MHDVLHDLPQPDEGHQQHVRTPEVHRCPDLTRYWVMMSKAFHVQSI